MHAYKPFVKPAICIALGGVLVFLSLLFIIKSGVFSTSDVEITDTMDSETKTPSESSNITVEVVGAVGKPGVYTLSSGSRIQDALKSAGDILPTANHSFIEKTINRAAKLVDGQKIYIPSEGDQSAPSVMGTSSNLININTGSQSELESLPGVGPVTASKIKEARPYGSISDLTAKKVVSQSVFEKIKDLITLY